MLLFVFAFASLLIQCASDKQSSKFQQYYVQGEQLYTQHCSNCHQKDGAGLGLLYPPVNTSDYMDNHFDEVICLIKNGTSGEMVVNGKKFNHAMPGIPHITDVEIAEISTYIFNSWGRHRGLVETTQVTGILSACKN